MRHPSLETITERLVAHARCELDDLCLPILQQVGRGKPSTLAALGASLQMSQDELEQRLSQAPDTEFDQQGALVGWGGDHDRHAPSLSDSSAVPLYLVRL